MHPEKNVCRRGCCPRPGAEARGAPEDQIRKRSRAGSLHARSPIRPYLPSSRSCSCCSWATLARSWLRGMEGHRFTPGFLGRLP